MSRLLRWGWLVSLLALPACGGASMGMDRGPVPILEATAAPVPTTPTIDSARIAEELGRRPQLPRRPRVAVYFAPPESTPVGPWRWTYEDRRQIVEAGNGEHQMQMFPLPPSLSVTTDTESIRYTAARYGADAVIVVRGNVHQRRRENAWAVTYALLLPILFAPAQEQDTVFVAEASMIDVRNGYLYLAAGGEASQSQQRAHVWIDGRDGIETSRRDAVAVLAEELGQRLASVREAQTPTVEQPAAEVPR